MNIETPDDFGNFYTKRIKYASKRYATETDTIVDGTIVKNKLKKTKLDIEKKNASNENNCDLLQKVYCYINFA